MIMLQDKCGNKVARDLDVLLCLTSPDAEGEAEGESAPSLALPRMPLRMSGGMLSVHELQLANMGRGGPSQSRLRPTSREPC